VSENGDFEPLHPKISGNSQTTVTINHQLEFAVDFFARGLHTRTAVACLPLRQLGFLVHNSFLSQEKVFKTSVNAQPHSPLMSPF